MLAGFRPDRRLNTERGVRLEDAQVVELRTDGFLEAARDLGPDVTGALRRQPRLAHLAAALDSFCAFAFFVEADADAVRACSITETGADFIVNASNDAATLGGGVSRALFNECGGDVLQREMKQKLEEELDGVLDEGDCLVTSSGTSKKFRHLLHVPAVDYRGPRARLGSAGVEKTVTSPERIQACTEAALRAAAEIATNEGRTVSVAFPLLGAGAGGLPVAVVCHSMIAGLRDFFAEAPEAAIGQVVLAVPEPERFVVCSRLVSAAMT